MQHQTSRRPALRAVEPATPRRARPTAAPAEIPPSIELRHLRYFLAVVDELHFGRAAARLHISQPPLSQAIRRLEDELGVRLLDRNSRGVAPTEPGRVFAEEARRVLADFDLAITEARRVGGAGCTLRIGCIHQLPLERMHLLLGVIRESRPDTDVQVTHLLALEQVRRLAAGDLDLGVFTYSDDHPDLVVEPLFRGEQLVAHLPKGHPAAGRLVLRPEDVAGEDLILFPRHLNPALHDRLLALAEEAGYRFRGVREAGGAMPRDVMLAVASGGGVALEPLSFSDAGDAGTLLSRRPLDPPLRMPDTVVAWRTKPPRHMRDVIDRIRRLSRSSGQGDASAAK